MLAHHRELSESHEGYSGYNAKWAMDLLDSSLVSQLTQAICVFSIAVTKFEGKFKLGQNRKPEDVIVIATFLQNHQRVAEQDLCKTICRTYGSAIVEAHKLCFCLFAIHWPVFRYSALLSHQVSNLRHNVSN